MATTNYRELTTVATAATQARKYPHGSNYHTTAMTALYMFYGTANGGETPTLEELWRWVDNDVKHKYIRTEDGEIAGWIYMHRGGWCQNPEHGRYDHDAERATMAELAAACERGEFELRSYVTQHVGGILHDDILL